MRLVDGVVLKSFLSGRFKVLEETEYLEGGSGLVYRNWRHAAEDGFLYALFLTELVVIQRGNIEEYLSIL